MESQLKSIFLNFEFFYGISTQMNLNFQFFLESQLNYI